MRIQHSAWRLDSSDDWNRLIEVLGTGHSPVNLNIIRHLKVQGVVSCVLEDPYIDRDYSSDYLYYYARTFRTHSRYCKRVHFFTEDVTPLICKNMSTHQRNTFKDLACSHYCGFCVIRPLPTAPIGRTILQSHMRNLINMEASVTCRTQFSANLLGVKLQVTGAAFLQQDARVGACAQVAIWMGMRHMHARHQYNWVSVADITRFATPIAPDEAESLPAGSDFLTSERMLRAISEAGYQPLCFRADDLGTKILPYVESGIPVILGLQVFEEVGHAVTVVGRIFSPQSSPSARAIDYVSAYIVHDDQRGPYLSLPLCAATTAERLVCREDLMMLRTTDGERSLNIADHANFAVVLMTPRVYSTAAAAEVSARDRINYFLDQMRFIQSVLEEREIPINERLLNELQDAYQENRLVLRTYLTSASGYSRYIAESSATDELKNALIELHLPHFTWITEISTTDSYNHSSADRRRMYGHTIIDATSTARGGDGLLTLHLPGLLFTTDVDSHGNLVDKLQIIRDDNLYECREKQL